MNIESLNRYYIEDSIAVESVPSPTLLERMPALVRRERTAAAAVIAHLVEIDRRKLYLDEACSSLCRYCVERLGYSEDEAVRRVRVARLARQFPQVLDELRSGAIHLTGLFLLSRHVTPENVDALLAQARGKSRAELQELIARWFPRPDAAQRLEPLVEGPGAGAASGTCAGAGGPGAGAPTCAGTGALYRLEPLSPSRYLVQFTASAELHQKIAQARELLSHVLPSGDLAALFERASDRCAAETGGSAPHGRRAAILQTHSGSSARWDRAVRRWRRRNSFDGDRRGNGSGAYGYGAAEQRDVEPCRERVGNGVSDGSGDGVRRTCGEVGWSHSKADSLTVALCSTCGGARGLGARWRAVHVRERRGPALSRAALHDAGTSRASRVGR